MDAAGQSEAVRQAWERRRQRDELRRHLEELVRLVWPTRSIYVGLGEYSPRLGGSSDESWPGRPATITVYEAVGPLQGGRLVPRPIAALEATLLHELAHLLYPSPWGDAGEVEADALGAALAAEVAGALEAPLEDVLEALSRRGSRVRP